MTNARPQQGQRPDISGGTAETKVDQGRTSPNAFFPRPLSEAPILYPKLCPVTGKPRFGKQSAWPQESCISDRVIPDPSPGDLL